ncbi:MAG: hypothetical protein M1820_009949 [Bogoriella megaspora]|nr:MAG: hypothetical protein M1820_009949 [Bogoriella megaspora]
MATPSPYTNSSTQHKSSAAHGIVSSSNRLPMNSSVSWNTSLPQSISWANATDNVDLCWQEWVSFRHLNNSYNAVQMTTYLPTATTTYTSTWDITEGGNTPSTSTDLYTFTETDTMIANGFTYWTSTYTTTHTRIVSNDEAFPLTTRTITSIFVEDEGGTTLISTPGYTNVSTPACSPPCQSQWNEYASSAMLYSSYWKDPCVFIDRPSSCLSDDPTISSSSNALQSMQGIFRPSCAQASVDPSACDFFREKYMIDWSSENVGKDPVGWNPSIYQSIGYQQTSSIASNGSTVYYEVWPSSSSLAPGCSLGCGGCAITGGSVRLLYWPVTETEPTLATSDGLAKRSDTESLSISGTPLLSPTVYLSYASIYASDSCGPIGTTHSGAIVPIPDPGQLSSIWQTWGMTSEETALFNYTDLNEPVPQSIYERQPQCASWSQWILVQNQFDGNNWSSNLSCPRTGAYAPFLAVPKSILRNIDPLWASCDPDLRGEIDPPHALTRGSVAAAPTPVDPWIPSASPQPASSPDPMQPIRTSDPSPRPSNPGSDDELPPPQPNDPSLQPSDAGSEGGHPEPQPNNPSPGPSDPGSESGHPIPQPNDSGSNPNEPNQGDPSMHNGPGSEDQADPQGHSHSAPGPANQAVDPQRDPSNSPDPGTNQGSTSGGAIAGAVESIMNNHGNQNPTASDPAGWRGSSSDPAGPSEESTGGNSPPAAIPFNSGGRSNPQVGGQPIRVDPTISGGIMVGDVHMTKGQEETIGGTKVSHGPSGVVIGGATTIPISSLEDYSNEEHSDGSDLGSPESPAASDPSDPAGNLVSAISGMVPGGNNAPSSAGTSNLASGLSGSRVAVPQASLFASFTGSSGHEHTAVEPLFPAPSVAVDGSIKLGPDHLSTVIDDQTVSLDPNRDAFVVDGKTVSFTIKPTVSASNSGDSQNDDEQVEQLAEFTDSSGLVHTITELLRAEPTAVVDGSITITSGGSQTVLDGKTLSLDEGALIVDGSTIRFSAEGPTTQSRIGSGKETSTGTLSGGGVRTSTGSTPGSVATNAVTSGGSAQLFEGSAPASVSRAVRFEVLVILTGVVGYFMSI